MKKRDPHAGQQKQASQMPLTNHAANQPNAM
jgi:hypothetical protein